MAGGGYMPVDTPPGAAPLPLGKPAPPNVKAPSAGAPRVPAIPKGPKASGKGRLKKPGKAKLNRPPMRGR